MNDIQIGEGCDLLSSGLNHLCVVLLSGERRMAATASPLLSSLLLQVNHDDSYTAGFSLHRESEQCVYVCVCERERERESESVCVCMPGSIASSIAHLYECSGVAGRLVRGTWRRALIGGEVLVKRPVSL